MIPTFAVSPLSPERACANSREAGSGLSLSVVPSFRLSVASYVHELHAGLNHTLVDERRPIRHDLFRLGPSAGEPRHAGRSVQDEGGDLAREAVDRRLIARTNADAKLHFRQLVER